MISIIVSLPCLIALFCIYAWHLNRGLTGTPPEARRICGEPYTAESIQAAYEKSQASPTDVRPFLKPQTGRRYVVVGGSGMVGGWIVKHLLLRGEDPLAVRIFDLRAPTRPDIVDTDVQYLKIDVTDKASVQAAFSQPWPSHVADKPLTVFNTVALVSPQDRKADFVKPYIKVNVEGTRNVLATAKKSDCSVFIATSSGSIGIRSPRYFLRPWERWPKDIFQYQSTTRFRHTETLDEVGHCYMWTKAQAEHLVCSADSPDTGFRTGCIRPSHGIYAHATPHPANAIWDYLSRGGTPSWLHDMTVHWVDAQNVSIGHLAYEHTLLQYETQGRAQNVTKANSAANTPEDVGGRTYIITDPSPTCTYGDTYKLISQLALTRPKRSAMSVSPAPKPEPMRFPPIPPGPMLLLAHCCEAYLLLRSRLQRHLPFLPALPALNADLAYVQPAVFTICTVHLGFDSSVAEREIGYQGAWGTLEGLCRVVGDWNNLLRGEDAAALASVSASASASSPESPVAVMVPKVAPTV